MAMNSKKTYIRPSIFRMGVLLSIQEYIYYLLNIKVNYLLCFNIEYLFNDNIYLYTNSLKNETEDKKINNKNKNN
jgi:hypothetical protein